MDTPACKVTLFSHKVSTVSFIEKYILNIKADCDLLLYSSIYNSKIISLPKHSKY